MEREESLSSFAEAEDTESLLEPQKRGKVFGPSSDDGLRLHNIFQATGGRWHRVLFLLSGVVVVAAFTTFISLVVVGVVPVPDAGSAWSHHHVPAGRFFQISDIHYDPLYVATANVSTFCRARAPYGYNVKYSGGGQGAVYYPFGQYGCDPPESLLNATLDAMYAIDTSPDFILITGDFVGHSLPTMVIANQAIANVSAIILEKFPHTQVLPVIGNNDVYPDYHLPYGPTLWMNTLADMWSPWLGADQQKTFRLGGYYSIDIQSTKAKAPSDNSLRVIVLNTVLYSIHHVASNATEINEDTFPSVPVSRPAASLPEDPDGQFLWLAGELQDAQNSGKRVIIVGHIPFGVNEYGGEAGWFANYTDTYLTLLNKYSGVIENQIYAHYHTDDFRITWGDSSDAAFSEGSPIKKRQKAASATIIHPSISPNHFNNPGFRYYQYNLGSESPLLVDYTHYYTDLYLANQYNKTTWLFEYSLSDAYQVKGVDTEAYETIYLSFQDTSANLVKYVTYKYADFVKDRPRVVCAIDSNNPIDFSACLGEAPPLNLASLREVVLATRPWWFS